MGTVERDTRTTKKIRRSDRRPSAAGPMTVLYPEAPKEAGAAISATAPVTANAPTVLSSPLDHILIFGHGWFQRLVLLCTTLAFFTAVLHAAAITSLARPVHHWCRPPAEYAHLPAEIWKNTSVPLESDGVTRSQCLRYEPPVPSAEGHAFEIRDTIPCDAGWDFEVDAESGVPVNSIVREWNIVCGRRWIIAALTAAYMSGGMIAAPFAGIAADRIGRRPVLCISVFLFMLAGIALVFAKTVLAFAVLRALLSASAASIVVTSIVVLFEVTDTQHRALFCSLAVAGGAFLASIYGAVVYNMVSNWKAIQIAYMVPTCALVLAVYLMDESPCWLLAVMDMRHAENVLSWAARVNNAEPKTFKRRLSVLKGEVKRQQEQQQEPASPDVFAPLKDVHQSLRQRSLVIFACWFVTFAVYYKLATGQVMLNNQGARTALALLRLPAILVNVLIIAYVGRRRTLAFSMLSLAIVAGALAAAVEVRALDHILAGFVVLWMLLFDLCVITLYILAAELYPTVVRGAGLALCYTSGRMGAIVAPFLNQIQSADMHGVVYSVAAALLLFFGVMAMALPETTELQPANTMVDFAAEKWQLYSPLRLARGGGKRKRLKSGEPGLHEGSRMGFKGAAGSGKQDAQ